MRQFGLFCCLIAGPFLLLPVETPGQPKAALTTEELRTLLDEARKKHDLPALGAAIVRGGQKPIVAVVGVRKRDAETLATGDDLWHLGSNTKPMTALLLAILKELGLLDWDTPLSQIFPDLADDWHADLKKITPAMLLTHTSGLPANWPLGWWIISTKGTPAEQRAGMMKKLGKVAVDHPPGEKYQYSNLGYTVVGAIVDRLGKTPWEEQIAKKIFQPLNIKHAGFGPTGKTDALLQPWPHKKNGKPVGPNETLDNPPIMNPAGRVHMSLADYSRFLAETLRLARGEPALLKPATAQTFFTNPHPPNPHSLSGWIGIRKKPTAKGLFLAHDGSNTMNYCTARILPDANLAICVFTNQGGETVGKACAAIRKMLIERVKQ